MPRRWLKGVFLQLHLTPHISARAAELPADVSSPDINTEDFSAAVDFLATKDNVDPEKIAVIGICGWGGMALNAAATDTRIKATVTSTMYDMTRVTANGYFDSTSVDDRYKMREQLNAQRTEDYKNGSYAKSGGLPTPEVLPEDCPLLSEGLCRLLQDGTRISQALCKLK